MKRGDEGTVVCGQCGPKGLWLKNRILVATVAIKKSDEENQLGKRDAISSEEALTANTQSDI